jgi:catechol 2,3-dioxygenase-like lactoylglutathione lyase family enzyme
MDKPHFTQQITFLHAHDLDKTRQFYQEILQLPLARDQGTCLIFLVAASAYLGFCEHIDPIKPGRKVILTLVCDDVDGWYKQLLEKGVSIIAPPEANPQYHIYHFFLKDPDGYWIEIQRFDQPL